MSLGVPFSNCHHEGDMSMKKIMNMPHSTVLSSESSLAVHCQSYETLWTMRPAWSSGSPSSESSCCLRGEEDITKRICCRAAISKALWLAGRETLIDFHL